MRLLFLILGFLILLGTIVFATESTKLHGILINNEQHTLQTGFYLSITAGILSVVTGILFCACRIDKQVPGQRVSHAVSVVRPVDTGLYKTSLHRPTFKSFQPNMPSRYNHM